MKNLIHNFRLFLCLTILTGVAYPLLITGIAQLTMMPQANGSFINVDGKKVGSSLIGQSFTKDKYFWGRPSAVNYNPLPSGGSNLGPTSLALKKAVADRKAVIQKTPHSSQDIPSELLFASGSGLDPHISPAAAYFQMERIIKARGLNEVEGKKMLTKLIEESTQKRRFGLFGEPVVNVLQLNLALDPTQMPTKNHE